MRIRSDSVASAAEKQLHVALWDTIPSQSVTLEEESGPALANLRSGQLQRAGMTDRVTPAVRSANMRAIRSKGMKPEMIVRKLVHRMGFRYRLHRHDLPGRPDLVFPSRKKVIFMHGCFWHQHSNKDCKLVRKPSSNTDYWLPKLERNVTRDREHHRALCEAGWEVLVVWECELRNDEQLESRLRRFLERGTR